MKQIEIKRVRLLRKESNGQPGYSQYRIAESGVTSIVYSATDVRTFEQWALFIEDAIEEGCVYLGSWDSIMNKYEFVSDLPSKFILFKQAEL